MNILLLTVIFNVIFRYNLVCYIVYTSKFGQVNLLDNDKGVLLHLQTWLWPIYWCLWTLLYTITLSASNHDQLRLNKNNHDKFCRVMIFLRWQDIKLEGRVSFYDQDQDQHYCFDFRCSGKMTHCNIFEGWFKMICTL